MLDRSVQQRNKALNSFKSDESDIKVSLLSFSTSLFLFSLFCFFYSPLSLSLSLYSLFLFIIIIDSIYKVVMLGLSKAASGTNLIECSHVILLGMITLSLPFSLYISPFLSSPFSLTLSLSLSSFSLSLSLSCSTSLFSILWLHLCFVTYIIFIRPT